MWRECPVQDRRDCGLSTKKTLPFGSVLKIMVEMKGLEPSASGLQSMRKPNIGKYSRIPM